MLRLIWPMDWSFGARRVNHILISFSSCKNELYVLFIFSDRNQHAIPLFFDACKTILSLGEDDIFVQCVVSYDLMLMTVPVKEKFEELNFQDCPFWVPSTLCRRHLETQLLFIFLTAISMQFLYFPMPVFYRYNFLIMNLQLTWCLILDTEMHLEIFETCFKTFLIFIPIIPDPLLRTTFTHKALGSLFNWTRFLEWNKNLERNASYIKESFKTWL